MKRSAIEVGKKYTDNKGNVRLVLGEGPDFAAYRHQYDRDCLRYRVIAKTNGPHILGSENNTTRASFAAWAKAEVTA